MKTVPKDCFFYRYSKFRSPALSIEPGETVRFETMDCLSNVLRRRSDRLEDTAFDKTKVNPAAGPVFIRGARPGDTLAVRIDAIDLDTQAVITCQAGAEYGILGDRFEKTTFNITPVKDGVIEFDDTLRIPVKKMIGVMATTPPEEETPTGMPGAFGGNLDNAMLGEGATLYLPVFVEGALFACGDVHAAMGDGEINCSALEAAAGVTLTFGLRKDLAIANPVAVTPEWFTTVASAPTLDEAVEMSVKDMARILGDRLPGIPPDRVSMLLSAVGETQICQVVSPLKTARFCIPARVLDAYGFAF